jgi:hypothetical protein
MLIDLDTKNLLCNGKEPVAMTRNPCSVVDGVVNLTSCQLLVEKIAIDIDK